LATICCEVSLQQLVVRRGCSHIPLPSRIQIWAIIPVGQARQRLDGLQKRGAKEPRAQLSIPDLPDDPRLHYVLGQLNPLLMRCASEGKSSARLPEAAPRIFEGTTIQEDQAQWLKQN
jgi:hypothetical protein